MKPFDLQAAIAGAKLQTRDGRQVTEFYFFSKVKAEDYPIHATVNGRILTYSTDGRYNKWGPESDSDLFMASEKKEGWINVWLERMGSLNHSCNSHPSKEAAFKVRREDIKYLGDPVKIWEEEV